VEVRGGIASSIRTTEISVHHQAVMNRLDPIEELYNMYSEEENTPRIIKVEDDGLDLISDVKGPADPYMDL